MKKLALLVVVAVVGYFGYVLFERQNLARYGISDDHPIGEFEKLDAILTGELKLPKSSISSLGNSGITPTARMYQYRDPDNPYIYVLLLLDRQNNLRGVAGRYQTPDNSPVGFFMEGHWRRTGGSRAPQFTGYQFEGLNKSDAGGRSPLSQSIGDLLEGLNNSQAQFAKGQVKGTWNRSTGGRFIPPGYTYYHIYLRLE